MLDCLRPSVNQCDFVSIKSFVCLLESGSYRISSPHPYLFTYMQEIPSKPMPHKFFLSLSLYLTFVHSLYSHSPPLSMHFRAVQPFFLHAHTQYILHFTLSTILFFIPNLILSSLTTSSFQKVSFTSLYFRSNSIVSLAYCRVGCTVKSNKCCLTG